jgi:hypothetical protein
MLDFFENVRVNSSDPEHENLINDTGTVIERFCDAEGQYFYTVLLLDNNFAWNFSEDELVSLGTINTELRQKFTER